MKNSLEMVTEVQQLLPLDKLDRNTFQVIPMVAGMEEFRLRPTPKAIIDNIIPSYLNGFIYSALVESFCSEQNARMTAMDSANRNGGELKQQLRISIIVSDRHRSRRRSRRLQQVQRRSGSRRADNLV